MRIDILDTNDEAPQFTLSSYNKTISEGDKAGTSVVTVSAYDKDLVSLSGVVFALSYLSHNLVDLRSFSLGMGSPVHWDMFVSICS